VRVCAGVTRCRAQKCESRGERGRNVQKRPTERVNSRKSEVLPEKRKCIPGRKKKENLEKDAAPICQQ